MRIGVIGLNHKLADVKLREELARACESLKTRLQSFSYLCHFVILSTCNRIEIYFSTKNLTELHTKILETFKQEIKEKFEQKLYSFFGPACFLHLAKVCSGLDSAIFGESNILFQVKETYSLFSEGTGLSKELHFLFQKSLSIAKKIQTEFDLSRGLPNIQHAVLQKGQSYFSEYLQPKILVVGVSKINQSILNFLKLKSYTNITICNRTLAKAEKLAAESQVNLMAWQNLYQWTSYDWLILGTKASHYLITPEHIQKQAEGHFSSKTKLIIDLSVPRNVDPTITTHPSIQLFNIDEINHLLSMRHQNLFEKAKVAEKKIQKYVEDQLICYSKREKRKDFFVIRKLA